jgi:hypothetical protein
MTTLYNLAHHLLNNQPNSIVIGYSKRECKEISIIPFQHISRQQQIDQVTDMINCGISLKELQEKLYLVSHCPTQDVWKYFGVLFLD